MSATKQNHEALNALLARTARNDRAAFREIYAATSGRLYSDLLKLLGNPSDATDVLQEVYVTIWRQADRYDPTKGQALAWIARVARNAGIDALRRRKPEINGDALFEVQVSDEPTPFEHATADDTSSTLSRSLEKLPDAQRRAVTMYYLEENSLSEVADRMGAPINTIKSWVRRGLSSLSEEFRNKNRFDFI